eukprot:gene4572-6445_t
MSVFSTIAHSVHKLHKFTSDNAQKLTENIDKIALDPRDRFSPESDYGSLWEMTENVENCRQCDSKFQQPLINRKLHCRSCAGVFCENCCQLVQLDDFIRSTLPINVANTDEFDSILICDGCKRGECVGMALKHHIRSKLDAAQDKNENQIDKFQKKIVAKVNETIGLRNEDALPPSKFLSVAYGSFYGEDGKQSKNLRGKSLAVSGYVEIFNKSNEVFCVKLLQVGGSTLFEIPRPSYLAVPPLESVYSFFQPDSTDCIELLLLFNNPNSIPNDSSIHYNTKALGANPSRISKCARVDEFLSAVVYRITCKAHNVMLKYKGDGIVIPRNGDSWTRVGIIGKMQGRRFTRDKIDFETNIDTYALHRESPILAQSINS